MASAAALLAIWALFQSHSANSPAVSVSALPVNAHHSCDESTSRWSVVALVPLRVTNSGGRTTHLTAFTKRPASPLFIAQAGNGEPLDVWYRLLLPKTPEDLSDLLFLHDIEPILSESRQLVVEEDRLTRTVPSILNIPISAGESIIVSLGFEAGTMDSDYQTAQSYRISMQSTFSHGQSYPVDVEIKRPFVGRYLPACR